MLIAGIVLNKHIANKIKKAEFTAKDLLEKTFIQLTTIQKILKIQNGCDNDFSAYILNSNLNEKFDEMDEASIHVRFFDKSSHKDKVKKNIRCAGTEREKQKLFVCSNGLSNTLSENILHNNSIGENGSK